MRRLSISMQTAVMIESNEKTMSMIMICRITPEKVAPTAAEAAPFSPSSSWWISLVLFHRRKRPPAIRMRSRPEISWRRTVKRGSVRPLIQTRSEEHTSELQSPCNLVCRLLLEKKKIHIQTQLSVNARLSTSSQEHSAITAQERVLAYGPHSPRHASIKPKDLIIRRPLYVKHFP